VVKADLAIEAETLALGPQAIKALGPLTALINNASIFERDEVESVTRASWDAHMEANLRAPFVLIQEFAKQLPESEKGAVINLLDQRVWNLTPHFTSYTISKAGLWTATQTLAMALAPHIRVNAIGPGPILPSPRQSANEFSRQCASTPLGHGAKPEEIAAAVRFLLDSPSVTGQMIAIDGGQHLSNPAAFTIVE
jgi:NAD(P)-dependent dehydrogenase (short-subunit alcohol dehydrogenase family)